MVARTIFVSDLLKWALKCRFYATGPRILTWESINHKQTIWDDNICKLYIVVSKSLFSQKSPLDHDKSHLCAYMIPNWYFESPVALASPVLPLLPRTHLNPSTCALTMQSCHYRKTTKDAFLFLAQPMTWHCTGRLPLQRNKVPSKIKLSWNRSLSRISNTPDAKQKKIPAKREKDWTGTRSSPHTLQVQNGGPANLM